MYRVTEGESVEVCAVILGPEQISTGLQVFATITAVPDTADGKYSSLGSALIMVNDFSMLLSSSLNRE